MSLTQLETIRLARLQLIDLGDEKTASLLAWALEDKAVSASDAVDPRSPDPRSAKASRD